MENNIISVRFQQKCIQLIKKISTKRGIKPAKLIEIITNNYIEILDKCFDRRDIIVQRVEMQELYNKLSKNELDDWIEIVFPRTLMCMKLLIPKFELDKISDTWMKWYELNSHQLEYEDNNGYREFHCITDMGYNWVYVYGKVYYEIFESNGFKVSEFNAHEDGFNFKVKIPVK